MTEKPVTNARYAVKRIFQNAGALISGKAVGGVLSLAYLAIAARSLGPTEMGYLVLAHAYVMIVSRVARFQSWQAVIRFGAPQIAAANTDAFKTLIRFTVKLDLLSAVIAVVIAVGFAGLVGKLMNWPDQAMPYILAYCWAAPFLMAATPTGILRLFDRFLMLSWQSTLMPITRFIGAIYLLMTGGTLVEFLIVWIVSALVEGISLWVMGWIELRKQNLMPSLTRGNQKAEPTWLPFMIKTNLSSTIDQTQTLLPVLVVGAVLGGAASGFLQLATNLSNLIAHPTNMLNHATYPELSKINTNHGLPAMRNVAIKSIRTATLVAAPIVAIYMIFGKQLAVAIGGTEFAPAGILVALMAMAQLWRIISVIFESGVVAIGRAGFVLAAQAASAIVHFAVLFFILENVGTIGAPIAIIAGWATLISAYIFCLYRKPGTSTAPTLS